MKGIILEKVGGDYALSESVEKPSPGKNQILVKSLVTAMNPVEAFMQGSGLMVTAWPIVLGCDASGTVVEVGEGVTKFKKGDGVLGCTVLGVPGHSTFQEYFLMNEKLTFKKPKGITTEQAATVGVGLITAALGLMIGTKVELEKREGNAESPWLIILGGAGSVGQFAIQLAKVCGYRVLTSCSPSNNEMVKAAGADATFNYRLTLEEQLAEIENITGGNFSRIFDASSMGAETGLEALAQNKSTNEKYFSTTNDWTPIGPKEGVEIYKITLGEIGRSGNEHIEKVNKDISDLIPKLEDLLEAGLLKPLEYVRVGDVGVEEVLKALDAYNTHKSGKKIVGRLAEE